MQSLRMIDMMTGRKTLTTSPIYPTYNLSSSHFTPGKDVPSLQRQIIKAFATYRREYSPVTHYNRRKSLVLENFLGLTNRPKCEFWDDNA